MRRSLGVIAATAIGFASANVQAHHSTGAFDMTHPVVVTGTLTKFVWGNPHAWISMMVPDGKGGADLWEIEGPSVTMLVRNHWKANSIQPGDKIHVMIAPRYDGKNGGTFQRVTLDDGRVLDTGRLKTGS
jgi:hypothetical protein